MAYLLLAIGALLSIAGTYLAISGYHIVQIEEGWTSVIAGATLFVGGLLIMALGLVLRALLQLRAAIVARPLLAPAGETDAVFAAEPASVAAPSAKIEPKVEDRIRPERADRIAAPTLPRATSLAGAAFEAPAFETPIPAAASQDAAPHVGHESPYASPALMAHLDPVEVPHVPDDYELETPSTPEHDLVVAPATTQPLANVPEPQTRGAEPHDLHTRDLHAQDLRPQELNEEGLAPQAPEPRHVPVHEPDTALTRATRTTTAPSAAPPTEAPPMGDWLDQAFAEFDQELPKAAPTRVSEPRQIEPRQIEPGPLEIRHADLETRHVEPTIPVEPEPILEPAFAADVHPDEAIVTKAAPAPATRAASPPAGPAAAVIGRYESDGTSYVMYADGSIEAHSENGVYRFASMADLKAFIET